MDIENGPSDERESASDDEGEPPTYVLEPDAFGHAMVRPIILTRTDERGYDYLHVRRMMVPEVVTNPRYPKASVRMKLMHQKRHTPRDAWHEAEHFDLRSLLNGEEVRLELDAGETRRLYDELSRLYAIESNGWQTREPRKYVVTPADDAVLAETPRMERVQRLLAALTEDDWEVIEELQPGLLDTVALKRQHEARREALHTFEAHLSADDWAEGTWQKFFENHKWIFGHNLLYQFVTPVAHQPRVGGEDLEGRDGQRSDFYMATEARARFTVLVDIKKPSTELVGNRPYRNQVYQPGPEIAGGVVQLQSNCHTWLTDGAQRPRNVMRLAEQHVHTYSPRGILIVGRLDQLDNDFKIASFEHFRRNTLNPEIVTYDELLERARYMTMTDW